MQHANNNHQQTNALAHPLFWLCITVPIAIHFLLLFLYAVNAPRLDDFTEILTFLPDWHAAANNNEKWGVFFRDYQDHRYVLYHFFLIVFDHINFRTATIVGNVPLIALCALMMKCTATHPQKKILWLVTPLLVFNLQTWRAMFWGPLGTTNLLYPAVALLACWLATRGKQGVIAAACTAVLLTLSHGSGPILFPVIAVYLWAQMKARHYEKNLFLGWLLCSFWVFLFYFIVFPLQQENGHRSIASSELLTNFFTKTAAIIKGFLALMGSHLLINDARQPWKILTATLLGGINILLLVWLMSRGALRHAPALRIWLAFLLLTAACIAVGRVAYGGLDQALQSHYKLLNGILLWFCIVALLDWMNTKPPTYRLTAEWASITFATMLYASSLVLFLLPMQTFKQALLNDVLQWQTSRNLKNAETRFFVRNFNLKLKAAIDGGFYDPQDQKP